MSKKKKPIKETTIENYYDLKVDKVDELVAALKDETPETAAKSPYGLKRFSSSGGLRASSATS